MKPMVVGDVVGRTRRGRVRRYDFQSALHVQRPDSPVWVGPGAELFHLHMHVAEVVLPVHVKGLALPGGLPAHAELGDNGQTPTARLQSGSKEYASERIGAEITDAYEKGPTPGVKLFNNRRLSAKPKLLRLQGPHGWRWTLRRSLLETVRRCPPITSGAWARGAHESVSAAVTELMGHHHTWTGVLAEERTFVTAMARKNMLTAHRAEHPPISHDNSNIQLFRSGERMADSQPSSTVSAQFWRSR
ncbi:hypothetical protein [Nocardia sp. CA-119907]|uniref:hypothetical protein n=1 Tax=Nocardia sp. CA-119907 TaxID=3239973 RepID=UPI003D95DC4C